MQDAPGLATDPSPTPFSTTPSLPAPLWHTLAFLLLLATWATIGAQRTHGYANTPHIASYLSMMVMTWMLFATAVAGIHDRAAFFFASLRNRALPFSIEFGRGTAIYLGVYGTAVVIAMVLATATLSYKTLHRATSAAAKQTSPSIKPAPRTATPVPPPTPTSTEPVSPSEASKFRFNSKTVLAIAPRTPFELLLWLAISATAGFCEEHIFRGYLLKQALAITQRAGLSRLLATVLSVTATSLVFGSLHLYEGLGGAALITLLGIVYAIVSLKVGNLRAVIIAHFLQDAVAGFFLFAYRSLHIA